MTRSRLGPLAVESKLGDYPSQSIVWRAIHVKQHKAVALKVFAAPFGGTREAREAFAAEWERLKAVQHPAIARCYGGGFEATDAYLASELIDGETLLATLQRRQRLPWETVLDMAEPLIEAIEYLHGRGIHHGRIQPDKIVFAGLSPVLIDVRCDRGGPIQSGRPASPEELAYRAPELIDDPAAVSARGDLYSLGAVMYHCLTGRTVAAGQTAADVIAAVKAGGVATPASLAMDCPVWLDKLVMQLIAADPQSRPVGAGAVKLALAEVRRRSMSRAGVAEHASAGFSPLRVTSQKDRDEARELLGKHLVDDTPTVVPPAWYERSSVLVLALAAVIGLVAYFAWPMGEDEMRRRAETLIAEGTRSSLSLAKTAYLIPMQKRFPDGKHLGWVAEQVDQIDMVEAEQLLSLKLKRNLPLSNEGERLYAEAQRYERFGDSAAALDQYRSIVTLMEDQNDYRPFVNLARRQIAQIESDDAGDDEASQIIQSKLSEADSLYRSGNVVAAQRIWYSIVDLYEDNVGATPLVQQAQARLAQAGVGPHSETPRSGPLPRP